MEAVDLAKKKVPGGERERIVTVRVPESVHKPARVRASEEDRSFQEILLQALAVYGSGSVPIAEQAITCPACESTISVAPDGTGKVMELSSVLKTEQVHTLRTPGVQSLHRDWMDLVERATKIHDSDWAEMLENIKRQLAQVANIADSENPGPGEAGPDLQRPGGGAGTPRTGTAGGERKPATGRHRKKAS